MINTICQRSVRFRDANYNAWNVTFELRKADTVHKDYASLRRFHETQEVAFSGEGLNSCGQCYDSIAPRTESQTRLIEFWKRYHLGGMRAGTDKQSFYLGSSLFSSDYEQFVTVFSACPEDVRENFDETAWKVLQDTFRFSAVAEIWVRKVVETQMNSNPVSYILGKKSSYNRKHDMRDFSVKCFFLAMRGIYQDRGYSYGSGWLFEQLPDDFRTIIDEPFDQIEADEAELTESLEPVFDMGAEDFQATSDIVERVMELRDCDEVEAKRFIALGMELGYTFGDLNHTFEVVDESNLYRADGQEYYVGTEDELYTVAENYMKSDDYTGYWREAVQAKQTEMGLAEWRNYVLNMDGWCSILNHWNGKYDDHKVGEEWICVSRT